MNRDEVSAVTHGDLPFANPLSEAAIDAGIAALDLRPGAHRLAGVRAAGWEIVAEHAASGEDWARYEDTLIAQGEARLADEPDPDLRARVGAAKARWGHPDGKDTLGFTLLALRKR